ncbi:carbohydrate-binding module family 20 domain-containing protein [Microcella alkalica]|uniref:Alpha-amylase n=1 Tax=Microcella alkalica TaxID=355930 RepID=A0A839ECV4_9MICO|nr:alpha-amylase family protein [Microcella alkalica]MBA8849036.1 alpha-amylase [Microcella alkalica]
MHRTRSLRALRGALSAGSAGALRAALAGLVAAVTLGLAACSPAPSFPEPADRRDAGILMFQWTWDAIAAECPTLGEIGLDWVLTSPPQEHVVGPQWWVAYQPVSHRIESRLGSREQFAAMVESCGEAGVDIVADAVINHMSGQDDPGVGWAGSEYDHYSYPGLFAPEDFHRCTESPTGDIIDYRDRDEVQRCELVNLADLATGTDGVRERLRAYLDDLLSLGVAGFRIDAAKHMPPEDIAAIVDGLPEGTRIYQEVIRGQGEPIQPEEYAEAGPVWEFSYARTLTSMVESRFLNPDVRFGPEGRTLPSERAISFVDNHDTERNGETLSYKDGEAYALATAFLLAHPYGTPQLTSGYAFEGRDAGAPADGEGRVVDASCADAPRGPQPRYEPGTWVCPHNWDLVRGLLVFRAAVGDAPLTDATEFEARELRSVSGFGRGAYGFVAFNAGATSATATFGTSLVPGRYTDAVSGAVIEVDGDGRFTAEVPGLGVIALHVGAVER